jgi:uncharacterized integral membrane protein
LGFLTFIITLPLTVLTVVFAVSNAHSVQMYFYPGDTAHDIPMYMIGLSLLLGGFFLGALFVSLHAQKTLFQYWKEKSRAEALEKELDSIQKKSDAEEEQRLALPGRK